MAQPTAGMERCVSLPALAHRPDWSAAREGASTRLSRLEQQFEPRIPLSSESRRALLVSLTGARETKARAERIPAERLARAKASRPIYAPAQTLEVSMVDVIGAGSGSGADKRALAEACLKGLLPIGRRVCKIYILHVKFTYL